MDWLLAWGVTQTIGSAFKPILKELAKEAAKDWVKDFFKGLPSEISQRALQIVLPTARDKAIKAFLQLVQKELEANGLDKKQVKQYTKPLSQFLKNKAVREILGSAFQKDCKTVNTAGLKKLWQESKLKKLPDNFNWELVATPYYREVIKIRRESNELRAILDSENLEKVAKNTEQTAKALQSIAGIIPDFNLGQYRESLREAYGYLKLNVLDSTDYQYRLRLWNLFIPQRVREALPPSRYELPKEVQHRLREGKQLEAEFSLEEVERYRNSYFQQPVRPVLEVLKDDDYPYAVILGDPGSGKSTLLQYLALQWAEEPTEQLPLLVELREYIRDRAQPMSFLEFFHRGTSTIQKLNQEQLHKQLESGRALVMFDGLDEVFEPDVRQTVITEIIRFTNTYKKVQVVVTSRIIGYNPERLRDAEFRHLTLQDFEPAQIQEFIEKWHDLALGNDPDKEMLKTRLQTAIADSKAIAELAENPLLLTMMAILNRRQELPRDRAELYEQASRVLLYAWDVDYKRLKVPPGAIGRREKQAILRQVAYEMQAGEKSLKGNIIEREKLLEVITQFLKEQGFDQPREKAEIIIQQLRERNFILCYLGDDYYGFVHRTFLEYFCAWELVWQFEKKQAIDLKQLKIKVFGKHWQDESWHEVLCLIAGMIEARFVGEIIEYLMSQEGESEKFLNLFLSAKCLSEVRSRNVIAAIASEFLKQLKSLTKYDLNYYYEPYIDEEETRLVSEIRIQAVAAVAATGKDRPDTLPWLKTRAQSDDNHNVRRAAVRELARGWKDDPKVLSWLKKHTR